MLAPTLRAKSGCEQMQHYSITSSAMARSEGGTLRRSIWAFRALMISSNLLDCTTGQVRRLGVIENATGVSADEAIGINNAGAVAHQPTRFGRRVVYVAGTA
jgi:hypothetical protein